MATIRDEDLIFDMQEVSSPGLTILSLRDVGASFFASAECFEVNTFDLPYTKFFGVFNSFDEAFQRYLECLKNCLEDGLVVKQRGAVEYFGWSYHIEFHPNVSIFFNVMGKETEVCKDHESIDEFLCRLEAWFHAMGVPRG